MLKHLLFASAYILLAVAVGLISPDVVPMLAPPLNWLAAGMVVLAGAVAHEAHSRSHARALAAGQINALRAENHTLREQVDSLRTALAGLADKVEDGGDGASSKSKEELDRVVSEVRVLQNLIEQLSATGGKPGAPKPAAAPEPQPQSEGKPETPAESRSEPGVTENEAAAEDAAEDAVAQAPQTDDDAFGIDDAEVLDIVREGLRKERVDLYLQPVVSLPQRRTRYYECVSRIRAEDGVLILPDQYMDIAKREGLMGAIDNMLLIRCVQLVRKVQAQNQRFGFFCNVSANTLTDRAFFSDFVEFMAANRNLARNLIFEFSQSDLEGHRPEIGEYATRLGQLGFSFSLDNVQDLTRLNFEVLEALGFRFIKIAADTLLTMQAAAPVAPELAMAGDGEAPPEPQEDTVVGIDVALLKGTMDVHGIDLVVDKIESEQKLVELLDYRIDFGQGYLFGEPRLSRQA